MKPLKYVADFRAYKLVQHVASSDEWSLHTAIYDHGDDHDDDILIKIFNNLDRTDNMYGIINEIILAKKCCENINIVRSVHCSFKEQNQLCVVMTDNSKKSMHSISIFKHGLPEKIVALVIMKTLEALDYMHGRGQRVHGNLNCENVFLDEDANVKLEFPTWLTNPIVKNIYPSSVYDNKKCDFSMVGILALDLFFGEKKKETNKLGCFPVAAAKKKLPDLLADFEKFCDDDSTRGPGTIKDIKSHEFFVKFCKFDQYQEDLKMLLRRKKLHKKN